MNRKLKQHFLHHIQNVIFHHGGHTQRNDRHIVLHRQFLAQGLDRFAVGMGGVQSTMKGLPTSFISSMIRSSTSS